MRHVELGRKRRVEDSGASVLDECPCDGVAAMPYRPGHESVAVSLDDISVLHLARLDLEAQSTDERSEHAQEVAQARRTDELERALPAMEVVGLEQAGKPEHVIGVVVGEGDQVELGQPERRAQELALGPLTAVDEHDVALAPDGRRRRRPGSRGRRSRRAEEDDLDIHEGSVADSVRPPSSLGPTRAHDAQVCARARRATRTTFEQEQRGPNRDVIGLLGDLAHDLPGALEELGERNELASLGRECQVAAAHGSTRVSPGWIVASASELRCMIAST